MLATADEIASPSIPAPLVLERLASAGPLTGPLSPGALTAATPTAVDILPRPSDQTAVLTDGAFFSLMVGLGETYLPAFALALGATRMPSGLEITTGLFAAIPLFFGAVLQLITPFAVRRLGSHRRWVATAVGCQAFSLLLLPLAILLDGWSLPVLFAAATMYWASGLSGGPPWNTWMEDVIPATTRTHFFAKRVRLCQFGTMLGFLLGGLLLEYGRQTDWLMPAFCVIFATAAASRFISTFLVANTSEPSATQLFARNHIGLAELKQKIRGHSGMRVLWFLFAMQVSVQLSGPYFTPFMLRKLQLEYDQFMVLIVLGFLGKVVALRGWGKVASKAGPKTLLWIGALSIVPVSGVWIGLRWIEQPYLYLCFVQFLGGIGWAAYELGFFLMFFESIPRRERTSLLTIYNFGNSAALLIGAVFGAIWLALNRESQTAYLLLFLMSSGARLLSLGLLRRC